MSFLDLADFNGSTKRNRFNEALLRNSNIHQQFVNDLNEQRRQRTHEYLKDEAAIKIQKCYRRYQAKRKLKGKVREVFDSFGPCTSVEKLSRQVARLSVCYEHPEDDSRLIVISGEALALARIDHSAITQSVRKHLLSCVLKFLLKASRDANVVVPLRALTTMATSEMLPDLVERGYFRALLKLIHFFTPDCFGAIHKEERLPPKVDSLCEQLLIPVRKSTSDKRPSILASLLINCSTFSHWSTMVRIVLPYCGRALQSNEFTLNQLIESVHIVLSSHAEYNKVMLVYAFVSFVEYMNFDVMTSSCRDELFVCISQTLELISMIPETRSSNRDEDEIEVDVSEDELARSFLNNSIVDILSSSSWQSVCVSSATGNASDDALLAMLKIIHKINKAFSMESLALNSRFVQRLWKLITSQSSRSAFGASNTYISTLRNGMSLPSAARTQMVACLSVFSALLSTNIRSIDDAFFNDNNPKIAFDRETLLEVSRTLRDIILGLIDLAFPDDATSKLNTKVKERQDESAQWAQLFDDMVSVVRTLQQKDKRVRFLPQEFWSDHNRRVVVTKTFGHATPLRSRGRLSHIAAMTSQTVNSPFAFVHHIVPRNNSGSTSEDEDEEKNVKLSATDLRNISIMKSIPFIVSFRDRNKMFDELLRKDREDNGVSALWGFPGPTNKISITVRRDRLYEDAFDALTVGKAPNLRYPMRVHMINWAGLDEAGVDGGGIFREFLSELLKTAFDPSRGFFQYTHDRALYPNPMAMSLYPDDYSQHFFFLGRIIAKLIYEKQLAEMRFADFFLAQLLGEKKARNVDLHHMKSYDPVLWHQLVDLRDMSPESLDALDIDFSVMVEEIGTSRSVNLIPDGRNVRVTAENRVHYVQLYVNFFLYERMRPIVDAMRSGVTGVLDVQLLAIFSPSELQLLVSGADVDIDIDDMRRYCAVHNVKDATDNNYMEWFWAILSEFTPVEKRAFLKFVTGCSRPPLDGFKELYPAMGIQLVHDSNHLPTSATCMNLLKLPKYSSKEVIIEKIKYSINAGAGFELS